MGEVVGRELSQLKGHQWLPNSSQRKVLQYLPPFGHSSMSKYGPNYSPVPSKAVDRNFIFDFYATPYAYLAPFSHSAQRNRQSDWNRQNRPLQFRQTKHPSNSNDDVHVYDCETGNKMAKRHSADRRVCVIDMYYMIIWCLWFVCGNDAKSRLKRFFLRRLFYLNQHFQCQLVKYVFLRASSIDRRLLCSLLRSGALLKSTSWFLTSTVDGLSRGEKSNSSPKPVMFDGGVTTCFRPTLCTVE